MTLTCIQCKRDYVTTRDTVLCGLCQRKKAKREEREAQLAELLRRGIVADGEPGE